MGMLDNGGMTGCLPPMVFEVKPSVFVRTTDKEYEEIVGVKSFERYNDEQGSAKISFVVAEDQSNAVRDILGKGPGQYVDVKMEFMIGMLMVMSFSGFVEAFSGNKVAFTVTSPITTDVLDVAQ